MDLRLLHCFVTVADAGSVTAAAQELYVSQPSLSRQLHRLEREIGLVLFRPAEGRLAMTSAGRQLLPRARALLATASAVRTFARDIASGAITTVQIAASASTTHDILAAFIAAETHDLPPLAVRSAEPEKIYEALDGGADLAVGENVPPGHLAVAIVARRTVHAFVPTMHELAVNGSVTLAELVEHDLLLPDSKRHIRRIIDQATAEEGLAYRVAGEYDCAPVALAQAAAGRGVAVACDDSAFGLLRLPLVTSAGPMTAPLFAAWPADHHATLTLADLADRLSQYLAHRQEATSAAAPGDAGGLGRAEHQAGGSGIECGIPGMRNRHSPTADLG